MLASSTITATERRDVAQTRSLTSVDAQVGNAKGGCSISAIASQTIGNGGRYGDAGALSETCEWAMNKTVADPPTHHAPAVVRLAN